MWDIRRQIYFICDDKPQKYKLLDSSLGYSNKAGLKLGGGQWFSVRGRPY